MKKPTKSSFALIVLLFALPIPGTVSGATVCPNGYYAIDEYSLCSCNLFFFLNIWIECPDSCSECLTYQECTDCKLPSMRVQTENSQSTCSYCLEDQYFSADIQDCAGKANLNWVTNIRVSVIYLHWRMLSKSILLFLLRSGTALRLGLSNLHSILRG